MNPVQSRYRIAEFSAKSDRFFIVGYERWSTIFCVAKNSLSVIFGELF